MAKKGRPRTHVRFEERQKVETSKASLLRYVAAAGSPLERFHTLLGHQASFLKWVEQRHVHLTAAKERIASLTGAPTTQGPNGPKSETFRKYQSYSQQLVLLEAVNGFEVFFKNTFIELARCLRSHVPDQRISGSVDARVLWMYGAAIDPVSVLFESRLFHDTKEIDKVTQMLIEQKYYSGKLDPHRQTRLQALKCIFQIRHTLSHNSGVVTHSDASKFKLLGYVAEPDRFINPSADGLGEVVFEFLKEEASEYTDWLRDKTVQYLTAEMTRAAASLPDDMRGALAACLGGDSAVYADIP